uniref:RNA pseudouridine synthase D3 n=1 Tax=Leptobrachium leishanense TaxID=445787 RepID=A0A8C5QX68_9ANUR
MEALCHRLLLSRSFTPLHELGSLMATRSLSSETVPWYRTNLNSKKTEKHARFGVQESHSSILKDPGVVNVAKLPKEKLCKLLSQNIVYMKGNQDEFSLSSLLPELQRLLGISELHIVKAATKESSGLVLLSTCYATSKHFGEFYSKCRKSQRPVVNYCAVIVGVPSPSEGDISVALKIETIGDHKLVVPVPHASKGSLERKEAQKTVTRYQVLDSADGCALVQLQPMSAFQSQLLVHMAWKLCKVLGDHTYSARVGKVLGEPIHVPMDIALPQPQMLEERMLRRMHLVPQQVHRVPLHLHLHQLLIPDYPEGKGTQIVTAPPPPFFIRTVQHLGLTMKEPSVLGND